MCKNNDKIMAKMKKRIQAIDTQMLIECLEQLGGGYHQKEEARLVRALMLDEYEDREGEAAVDRLELRLWDLPAA